MFRTLFLKLNKTVYITIKLYVYVYIIIIIYRPIICMYVCS